MLELAAGKAFEDRLGIRCAQTQGRGILDHLIVLLADETPPNRPFQDGLQMRIGIGLPGDGPIEFLAVNTFEPRQEVKSQQMAKRKPGLA